MREYAFGLWVSFLVCVAFCFFVGACAYTAHENNLKDKEISVACVKSGGEIRNDSRGYIYCDQ
jgi:uncharacterized membrane protein YhiD involved in acid resistance